MIRIGLEYSGSVCYSISINKLFFIADWNHKNHYSPKLKTCEKNSNFFNPLEKAHVWNHNKHSCGGGKNNMFMLNVRPKSAWKIMYKLRKLDHPGYFNHSKSNRIQISIESTIAFIILIWIIRTKLIKIEYLNVYFEQKWSILLENRQNKNRSNFD